ncbi:GH92 family glycosyl hydrolase [Microbacterium flavum]|uniref:GH92 family glycosyl hydrolase n=1 Tax=Microbacterium flavum TaxID=415216 RepID=A0ABS5XUN5_9MICO|nr:GH92 family glycosyl hydrolase [Microbacterium flavum]MBT8798136.1 GH92 family glycosyl hydrolase [Microbacterium flavum]
MPREDSARAWPCRAWRWLCRLWRGGDDDGSPRVFRGAPRHPVAARSGTGLFGPDALAWTVSERRSGSGAGAAAETDIPATLLRGLGTTEPGTAWTDDEHTVGGADLLGHVVAAGEVFRYAVLTEFRGDLTGDARFAAAAACLDIEFDDGVRLSELAADIHGIPLDPQAQHDGLFLLPDQWVRVEVPLGAAAGRTVRRVILRTLALAPGRLSGFADGIEIAAPRPLGPQPTDAVRTRRGTHSSERYSRGLTLPSVATPHALIMATPVTDARTARWMYTWHAHAGADGRPGIEAFATTLAPSPWIGERAAFQVMPSAAPTPPVDPATRRLAFRHRDEYDRVHHYRVELDPGRAGPARPAEDARGAGPLPIIAELAPARAATAMRFTLPGGGSLLFDRLGTGEVSAVLRPGGATVSGFTDQRSEDGRVVPRMYVWGEVDGAVTATGRSASPFRDDAAWVRIARDGGGEGAGAVVEVRLGVSFLSLDQARANLAADIGGATFDEVSDRAREEWDAALGAIEVEGATREQRITLASGLVRALMFPNTAHEFVEGRPVYASPFRASAGDSPERTGLRVVPGRLSVNNGFWDTYRTAWPLLGLIDPATPDLVDGILQHARDGGWMSRWTAPGPLDVMVGTSSDAIVADLARKGMAIDHRTGWAAGVRNATVLPPSPVVGRKGQARALFRSFTSADVAEGMSWTLEAAINDHALGRYAAWLAERSADPGERESLLAHAEWFAGRAAVYAAVFDPATGFFRGRRADGAWRGRTGAFDPDAWGTDYVETNAWGMSVTVPHDGAGLAALHGGPAGLAALLERFFRTPERGDRSVWGGYGHQIHEISEARDQRLGMLALSNQPAHHIPAMWAFAGRPGRAHEVIRTALDRLFAGVDLGQGNPGDEDNGEMSAWWILNAIGLYPLIPGEPGWFLTPPLFPRVRLRLPAKAGGEAGVFEITTSGSGRHIAAARLDGEEWTSAWLPHERIRGGARLHLDLTDAPSSWGAGAPPPSASAGLPRLPVDHAVRARVGGRDAAALVDDDGETGVLVRAGETIEVDLDAAAVEATGSPTLATVTVAGPARIRLEFVTRTATLVWRAEVDVAEVRTIPLRLDGTGVSTLGIRNLGDDLDLREIEVLSAETWSPARDTGHD